MSCRTQYYDQGNILRVICDTAGMEWVFLVSYQTGMAELIPLGYNLESENPAARRETIRFNYNPANDNEFDLY